MEYIRKGEEAMMGKQRKRTEQIKIVHPKAAGLDMGASEIWACIPPDRDGETVSALPTFTPDLDRLADWLVASGVDTVAMESTGVYWIGGYEILERRGLAVYLVNAQHIKHVPSRKSDVQDCQWIQKLHALGLLSASFRPDSEMRTLRTYLRHRAPLIEHRSPQVLHMQKALNQMNLQRPQVISDITGETGMAIVRAIVAGERDGVKLAQFRDRRCKSSEAIIAKALTGHWQEEHLFVLKQSLDLYDFYTAQIADCDNQILHPFSAMKPRWEFDPDWGLEAPSTHRQRYKNEPPLETRAELIRIVGVDLAALGGLGTSLTQTILSEIGTDMSRWPTDKHFASWLGLAPHNDISGGKGLRSRTLPTNNRAGQAFRQAATAVSRGPNAFAAFYRRKRAKGGPQYAQVATAHKLARTVYHLLKHRQKYVELSAEAYEQSQREREIAALSKRAAKLGLTLTMPTVSEPLAAASATD